MTREQTPELTRLFPDQQVMALQPGTRLGPYEVTAQIGVGGMGEVYKARGVLDHGADAKRLRHRLGWMGDTWYLDELFVRHCQANEGSGPGRRDAVWNRAA